MFSSFRSRADVLALFRSRDYRLYCVQTFAAALVERSQVVAIGWDLYERTGSALALGWVGLAQFVPVILLFLPAGHLADRFDRRRVMLAGFTVWLTAAATLAAAALIGRGGGLDLCRRARVGDGAGDHAPVA